MTATNRDYAGRDERRFDFALDARHGAGGDADMTIDGPRLLPPAPPHTYLGVTQPLVRGVTPLAAADACAIPLAFVAAQAAECILKAAGSKDGNDAQLKTRAIRHDLVKLWAHARSKGAPIDASPPDWLRMLSRLHASPYYLRYSKGIHGVVTPAPEPMRLGLEALLAVVERFVLA